MKYKDRDALVSSLREFADFLEEKGLEIPVGITVHASSYAPFYKQGKAKKAWGEILTPQDKKAIVKRVVRALKPVKKSYSGSYLSIKRNFGVIPWSMSVDREVVCKAVKTGNKIIHAAHYSPEFVEEEVEWVCTDPLLKATEEAA